MEKKKRFNYIYNGDEKVGYGKGYYIIFEGHDGEVLIDAFYRINDIGHDNFTISTSILEHIKHLIDIGYEFDSWYHPSTIKQLFE